MVAKIIAVVNQKGGVGKTTVSLNLACSLVRRGFRTLLVDADPQETSIKRAAANADYPVAVISLASVGNKITHMVKLHMDNYDFIIIDGPPSHTAPQTRAAVSVADLTLIPLQPSTADLDSTVETCALLNEVYGEQEFPTPTLIVVNMLERTTMSKVILAEAEAKTGYPLAKTKWMRRTSYKEAMALGIPMEEYSDAQAAEEVAQLAEEVIQAMMGTATSLKVPNEELPVVAV